MPKVIKKRAAKSSQSEENLRDTVDDIRSRIKGQQKSLVIALGLFLAVLIAAGIYFYYTKSAGEKAAAFQREAYSAFYNEGNAQPSLAVQNYKKALDLFRQSYDAKKKADVLLYIAYCQYGLGNYDETIATLKEFNTTFNDPAISPLAYYKLAETYLKKDDRNNAIAALNSIVGMNGIYQDMALMQLGKILELQGKTEEAKAKYKELVTKFPQSALAGEAKARSGQ
jgi:TolA-binding protein